MTVYTIQATAPYRSWIVRSGTDPNPIRWTFRKLLNFQRLGGDVLATIDPDFKDEMCSPCDVSYALVAEDH